MAVRAAAGDVDLAVANTGPVVPADEVERLLQPFQRLAGDRVGHGEGLGLGLSIVAAIANAHDAALEVRPGADGGLEIRLRFARADDRRAEQTPHPLAAPISSTDPSWFSSSTTSAASRTPPI